MYNLTQGHKITGQYGEDRKTHSHKGLDIAYPMNSDLLAAIGGTVKNIGNDPYGYGNYIDILSDNGLLERYAHANKFDVKPGDLIKEGQKIGAVGSTGRSTGPHVHFEVLQNGRNINPMDLLSNPKKYLKQVIGKPQNKDIMPIVLEHAKNLQMAKETPNPLDERVQNILAESLQNVPQPQEPTTIADIFNAKSGNRLNSLLDYLDSPEGSRLLGTTIAAINPKMEGMGERIAYPKQLELNKQKEDYQKQKENQVKLATDLYKELGIDKRFNKDLDFKGKQFNFEKTKFNTEQDYKKARDKVEDAFKNKELSQKDYELNLKALDSKAERELKGYQIEKIKSEIAGGNLTGEQKDKIIGLSQTQKDLQDFEALFNAKGIKQFKGGLASRATEPLNVALRAMNIKNPDETAFDSRRSLLYSNIARNLGGEKGVLSDKDIQRIGMSIPTLSDDPAQREAKIEEIYKTINNALVSKGLQPYPFENKSTNTPTKIKSIKEIK